VRAPKKVRNEVVHLFKVLFFRSAAPPTIRTATLTSLLAG